MWTKEITDMIINGVWATLYMTVASTVLGLLHENKSREQRTSDV